MSASREKLVLLVALEPLWLSTGTDTIADFAIPQSKWMLKL